MSLNEYDSRIAASELFSSGICNMNCAYCFIPKTEKMIKIHKEVEQYILSGKYIADLKAIYGKDGKGLTAISLWGTEPTLTMDKFTKSLDELIPWTKELDTIAFSSNFLANIDDMVNLVATVANKFSDRSMTFKIQVSLDGPIWVTDTNRKDGATVTVVEHLYYLIEELNKLNLGKQKVMIHFKPTITMDNIAKMVDDFELLKGWFSFFDRVLQTCYNINKNKNTEISCDTTPTMVVPGKYTTADGRLFKIFIDRLYELSKLNASQGLYRSFKGLSMLDNYHYRLKRLMRYARDIGHNNAMFTCSAGDSNVAISENQMHMCHRSYFLNKKEYQDSIREEQDIDNWDVSLFESGKVDVLTKKYVVDPNNELNSLRMLYSMRNYHDFMMLRISFVRAMLYELVAAGQASPIYTKNNDIAMLLSYFINTGFGCPAEDIINTGNIHLTPISTIKIWANGAFESLLLHYVEGELK
jgi:uncharacterized Fe-S cluster-containing radical SAM superfamily protein